MKSGRGPEVDEFLKGRSRAFSDAYSEFVKANGLEFEEELWPESKRVEYAKITAALADEWEEKAQQLPSRKDR